ncbi:RNA chaperone Hfq [Trinickia terrae]|uniref:RNA-binding protein Hfq n=1 Tax=Trinickia terrae TaxID=2571161 RepID=A0A4U1HS59_9BURK|nr:RNA chaperone Hfq [Trinickia terrae]TKC81666.1 RNA chaperone Hfq [Trinickia terrae]
MPNPAESHPQNDFMNAARKERKRVEIYLVNGIRLTGCIESFDQYLVMLRTPVGLQGIYKRAISTIQLDTGTRPGPRGPRTGGHGERHGPREGFGPRESRESREPRHSSDSYGAAPAAAGAPAERSSDAPGSGAGPVVVTRRRRPYGSSPGNNDSGNE